MGMEIPWWCHKKFVLCPILPCWVPRYFTGISAKKGIKKATCREVLDEHRAVHCAVRHTTRNAPASKRPVSLFLFFAPCESFDPTEACSPPTKGAFKTKAIPFSIWNIWHPVSSSSFVFFFWCGLLTSAPVPTSRVPHVLPWVTEPLGLLQRFNRIRRPGVGHALSGHLPHLGPATGYGASSAGDAAGAR